MLTQCATTCFHVNNGQFQCRSLLFSRAQQYKVVGRPDNEMLQSFATSFFKPSGNPLSHIIIRRRSKWSIKKFLRKDISLEKLNPGGFTERMLRNKINDLKKELASRYKRSKNKSSKECSTSTSSLQSMFNSALKDHRNFEELCDLTTPAEWYPGARAFKRHVIFHAGPTNSGKTHSALKQFLSSQSGIYCCPLRLLAREIAQKSNTAEVPCNLITGEEKDFARNSKHIACTVEMASLSRNFDIGVIDEIQIIADAERGWAWTQALLGLRAKELHVCGEPRAINIVQRLCDDCGDDFEVLEYRRLTKLRVKKYAVGTADKLRSGDCVVCFKRSDIYSTISELKKQGRDAAVIYGKLPPSTKRMEAEKFNSPDNSCDILVATDAIGMGLNLNIKRIVFQALSKGARNSNGIIENTKLTTPQTLQIAGRAGRYGLQESGEVTTLFEKNIRELHRLLSNPKEDIKQANLLPTREHLLNFSSRAGDANLFRVLSCFRKYSRINRELYALSSQRDCLDLAESMQRYKLPLSDAYTFSLCPVNFNSDISKSMFLEFVKFYSRSRPVTYSSFSNLLQHRYSVKLPILPEIDAKKIAILEDVYNCIGVYLWLAQKFPNWYPDTVKIRRLQRITINAITTSLHNVRFSKSPEKRRDFNRKTQKIRQKFKPTIHYR